MIFRIVCWLLERNVERALLAAIVRHQLFTALVICRGTSVYRILNRCRGGLTGSTLALTLGRIPVESTLRELLPLCFRRGFRVGKARLVFGSWVDNVYTLAHTPEEACESLSCVFNHLQRVWNLEMKEGSGTVLACRGADTSQLSPWSSDFKLVSNFDVLGWTISENATLSEQWRRMSAVAWGAFYANVRCRSWRKLGLSRRCALLELSVRSVILYKLQIFAPSDFWLKQLRKLQRHMLSRTLGNYRLPCESLKDYWQRVSKCVRELMSSELVSDWALAWAKSTLSWDEHAKRDFQEQERFYEGAAFNRFRDDLVLGTWAVGPTFSNGSNSLGLQQGVCYDEYLTSFSWACILTRHLDAAFFDSVRVTENRGGFLNATHARTSTRIVQGSVAKRYHDCVEICKRFVETGQLQ